jgi:hypothetical protein
VPYTATTVVYPAMGKQGELRALLEELVRMFQAKGLRANLAVTAFGDDPAYYLNIRFADLAAADAYRDGPLYPPADPAFLAKIAGLLRQPARNELREGMLLAAPGAPTSPIRYNRVATLIARPGSERQMLSLVLERARAEQAAGTRVNVSRPVAGTRGLRVGITFGSLAELDKFRSASNGDAARQKYVEQLTSLLAEPTNFEIREVILQMPAA